MATQAGAGWNWAGNYRYRARALHHPSSLAELSEIVTGATRLHVLGSRHSFNDVADTDGELISLDALPAEFELAADRQSVTVNAAARYGAVAAYLAGHGLTLRNFASLPHISVAGAISTGTHGSGDRNRCLAADVVGLELLLTSGELRHCTPQALGDDFAGVVVGLGALGVVHRVTLAVVPSFDIRQDVYEGLGWDAFDEHFADITPLAYSASMFTDFGAHGVRTVWLKSRVGLDAEPPAQLFGARRAEVAHHPIAGIDPVHATEQLGVPGLPADRLPHFRMAFTPSNGEELQSEYLVDRHDAVAAVRALRAIADRFAPLLQVSEIRTIAADDLWLSPSRGRESVGLHFTWVRDQPAVQRALAAVEHALAPFDPRPHWGKLFMLSPEAMRAAYPLLPRFLELADRFDPKGRFRNPFLARVLTA
jgi:alditol oxidase